MEVFKRVVKRSRGERSVARIVQLAFVTAAAGVSCNETTSPQEIGPPADVTAVMISPSSARISWTPGARSGKVTSYNVQRNGVKVAQVSGPSHIDEGLVELTPYHYAVSANGLDGTVSAPSPESPTATVTPPDVTAPRVASTAPASAAISIPRGETIRVTFSEAMTPTTINASTFVVKTRADSAITGTITYVASTFTAEFVPALGLPNATDIGITITTGVRDQSNNPMTGPYRFEFVVRDEIPPKVSSVVPVDLATGVSVETPVLIVFSETMNAATINLSSVSLRLNATGVSIPVSLDYDEAGRAVTLVPVIRLNPGVSYRVQVSADVKDAAGNSLAQDFASSFTTADVVAPPPPPPPDAIPPTVIASAPASGSVDVPLTSRVAVRFSEPIDASSINETTLMLVSNGSVVAGKVTYDVNTRVATLTPHESLVPGERYIATVTQGVRDHAENALASDYSFSFTSTLSPTAPTTAFLLVLVIDSSGGCIPNATVRVVLGQRAGEITTQKTPCDVWSHVGSDGVLYSGLIPGVEMTLQATAPGYSIQETTVIPKLGPQYAVEIVLTRN